MDFKFGKELIKALYKIRDAINNKKNNGGEEQNNGGEGSGDIKLIGGGEDFFFYDSKEIIVPELPSRSSANSIALSEIYSEEDINTIKDIFKRTLDCLEYNEGFRKFRFENNPMPDGVVFDIHSLTPVSHIFISNKLSEQIEESVSIASSFTTYTIRITNNSFNFNLQTAFTNSDSAVGLTIDFSNDYLFYDKTTGKYIWEMEGFDIDTLITGNTLVDYANLPID